MPMIQSLDGKKVSLILGPPGGGSFAGCDVLTGTAHCRAGRLFLDRGRHFLELAIPDDVQLNIQPVAPELRAILYGTEFTILLTPRAIPASGDEPLEEMREAQPAYG